MRRARSSATVCSRSCGGARFPPLTAAARPAPDDRSEERSDIPEPVTPEPDPAAEAGTAGTADAAAAATAAGPDPAAGEADAPGAARPAPRLLGSRPVAALRRHPRWVLAALALLVVAALVVTATVVRDQRRHPAPEHRAGPTAGLHIGPVDEWMNDVQRPVRLGGLWHVWALVNADHPDGNGTSWRHWTSDDLVTWHDQGIAIEKYTTALGDVESGSVVVDTADTSGLGAGAVVAIVTQQADGVQRQSLYASTDGGYHFEPVDGGPVLDNPGGRDFRDPKLIWDDARGRWVMVLAEGQRVGIYTSPDLRRWTYRSDVVRDDLGTLECPDLFPMTTPDDPGTVHWVLGASANGAAQGRSTGYAYWVGDFDGERFTTTDDEPRWLDHGSDYYAGVTWGAEPESSGGAASPDTGSADSGSGTAGSTATGAAAAPAVRYAMGWVSNWAYAGQLPQSDGGSGGVQSLVRTLQLVPSEGEGEGDTGGGSGSTGSGGTGFELRSSLLDALGDRETTRQPLGDGGEGREGRVDADTDLGTLPSGPSRVRVTLTPDPDDPARETRLRLASPDGGTVTVGVDRERGQAFVVRDDDAGAMPDEYRRPATAPLPGVAPGDPVALDLVVDERTLEVVVDDGAAVLTTATVGRLPGAAVSVEPVGGATGLSDASVARLRD